MTIRVFIGERASRTQENQILQSFLEALEPRWLHSNDWIVVIAFAMWEAAEVDLVCILPTAFVVADFKNYRGQLTGSENGPWLIDGVTVKGGAKLNPYVQLRDNRTSVRNWLSRKGVLGGRNLGHLTAAVLFSGPIADSLDISPRSKTWFHVTDFDGNVRLLDALASPELSIREDEALDIVRQLGVTDYHWAPSRPTVLPVPGWQDPERSRFPLTEHQQEKLRVIEHFLAGDAFISLSVCGMTSTGKTRLLSEAIDAVGRMGRVAIPLTPNRRLAWETNQSFDIECSSVYQHLYNFGKTEEQAVETEKGAVKSIPMRHCIDPDDCVYLIDDAHLLGNAEFRTPDGKRFGTGRVLTDLFDFTEIGNRRRKVIFFGDPYQIHRASPSESILDGSFQALRAVSHQSIDLDQVITIGKAWLVNALRMVEAIRTERYAALDLSEDDSFRIIDRQQAATELLEHFQASAVDTWYLAETHSKINGFTDWLRPRFLSKTSPASVEVGDLLEIYTIPNAREDGLSGSASIAEAGQRLYVEEAGQPNTIEQSLKGRPQPIQFRAVPCRLSGEARGNVGLLEDFLLTDKPELEADTLIALDVWQKRNEHPGFLCARYGYASTVHHAQGMKQQVCFVNAEHAAGRHSEGYFRWLYTSLTIARQTLILFNYEPIHALDSATWSPAVVQTGKEIPVGGGWKFDPEAPLTDRDQNRSVPAGLSESKSLKATVAIWLRMVSALEPTGWSIRSVTSHPFQERFEIASPSGESATIRVAYGGKNTVTALHINEGGQWQLLADIATNCIADNEYSGPARTLLAALNARLGKGNWRVVSAVESNYRLSVAVAGSPDEKAQIEFNYDKHGLVSSVRPLMCSSLDAVETVRRFLQ